MNVEGYVPLDNRVRAVQIAFMVMIVVSLVAVVVDAMEISLANQALGGEFLSDDQLAADDRRQSIAELASSAAWIACILTFLTWLSRAYKNLDAVAPGVRRYGTGWAIGAWFVPILALWRPKQIVNDVWRAGGTQPPPLLMIWWLGFIITSWLANLAVRSVDATTQEGLRNYLVASMAAVGFTVPIALLAMAVVVKTTERLEIARTERWNAAEWDSRLEHAGALPETARAEDGSFPSFPG